MRNSSPKIIIRISGVPGYSTGGCENFRGLKKGKAVLLISCLGMHSTDYNYICWFLGKIYIIGRYFGNQSKALQNMISVFNKKYKQLFSID